MDRVKILFIHNTALGYRRPLFKELSRIYDVRYVFKHMDIPKIIYNIDNIEMIRDLDGLNYRLCKNYCNWIKPYGIAFSIVYDLFGDYDVLIDGNWDCPAELFETIICFAIAKIRKKPFIIYYEEWNWGNKHLYRRMIMPLIKYLVRRSAAVITPGSKSWEFFRDLGVDERNLFIAVNAVEIASLPESQSKLINVINKNDLHGKKIILYVGRLIDLKNVDVLITAFYKLKQELSDCCLIIVGDGEKKLEYSKLCEDLGLLGEVFFTGWIKEYSHELSYYYKIANVLVLPSKREVWGFVLNEAMHFGKPVIATYGVGAAYDLIENGINGYIIPPNDVHELYSALKKILENCDLERSMGERSRQIIQDRFNCPKMIEGFKRAIDHVTDSQIR